MTANILTLKTAFLLIGLKQQIAKFHNCPIETTHSACNLGIIFDEHFTISDQISSLSKSCYSHPFVSWIQNCQYYCHIYCSLQTWLLKLTILQYTKFSDKSTSTNPELFAHTVVRSPRFSHITPVLKSLHWLKVKERIEYKLLSLTYKVLTTSQYLLKLVSVQSPHSTRSLSVVTISRPLTSSSLKITNRSF